MSEIFANPFRPGAGQKPPYLAGRQIEQTEFLKMLKQHPVIQNFIITGLRGVGKTVLLDTLKPLAVSQGWLWAGTDLSESATISEHNLCTRIIADLASITSAFAALETESKAIGFNKAEKVPITGSFPFLVNIYNQTPGLEIDKLKSVLESVWDIVKDKASGIVLAYDEAQILKDQAGDKQFPLSLLLESIQYLQRKQIPYLLVLTGLPTLFPNLVNARTYAERMFHIITIDKLDDDGCRDAIMQPIKEEKCPVKFTTPAVDLIIEKSGGYPYFVQFICKGAFDLYIQQLALGVAKPIVYLDDVVRKLDSDFYAGRWAILTDRQRDLMKIIATLDRCDEEFSINDISEASKDLKLKPFSSSYANQMIIKLVDFGLIYKNRYGKYSFAVPLLSNFIKRQTSEDASDNSTS